jgi:hypothetical protein
VAQTRLRPQDRDLLRDLIDYQDRAELAGIHDAEFTVVFILNDGDLTHPSIQGSRRVSMRSLHRLESAGAIDVQSRTDAAMFFWLVDGSREMLAPVEASAQPNGAADAVATPAPSNLPKASAVTPPPPAPSNRRPISARRTVVVVAFALFLANLAAIAAVQALKAPVAMHLSVTRLSDATRVTASSTTQGGGFALTSSVRTLDVVPGASPVTVSLRLDGETCLALEHFYRGNCIAGFTAPGVLEVGYSAGSTIIAAAHDATRVVTTVQPYRSGGFASICSEQSHGDGISVELTSLQTGTMSFGDGTTVFTEMTAGLPVQSTKITVPAVMSSCQAATDADLLIQGLGYPASVLTTGTSLEAIGLTGELSAGTLDRVVSPEATIDLVTDTPQTIDLSLRPEDPPLRTLPDPLVVSRLGIDGLDYTPPLAASVTWLPPVLEGTLLFILAVLGVAIAPIISEHRNS